MAPTGSDGKALSPQAGASASNAPSAIRSSDTHGLSHRLHIPIRAREGRRSSKERQAISGQQRSDKGRRPRESAHFSAESRKRSGDERRKIEPAGGRTPGLEDAASITRDGDNGQTVG